MRLAYWFQFGIKTLVTIAGACAIYGFLIWIQMDADFLEFLGMSAPLMMIFFGAVMLFAFGMAQYRMALNLSLSFGSTRREAMVGLHLYRLIPAIGVTALAVLIPLAFGQELLFGTRATILVGVGIMLLGSAVGMMTGLIDLRFGKAVSIIVCVLIVLAGSICGGFAIISADEVTSFVRKLPVSSLVALAGVSAYLLVSVPEVLAVRRDQVK